jgi:hypothetical protein
MDVPGISRPVLVVLIVVAVLLFAYGATKAFAVVTEHTDTHTRVVAAAPTIVVGVETGDVRITGSDRSDVRLTTKEKRSAWGGGHVEVSGDGARLHLGDRCDKVPVVDAPCSVSYVLEVPRNTAVRVVAGTGDLHAENLGSSADLSSGTGDLHVEGVRGALHLKADTGDVHVEAPAPEASVETGTGDVDIVASQPRSLSVQTGRRHQHPRPHHDLRGRRPVGLGRRPRRRAPRRRLPAPPEGAHGHRRRARRARRLVG